MYIACEYQKSLEKTSPLVWLESEGQGSVGKKEKTMKPLHACLGIFSADRRELLWVFYLRMWLDLHLEMANLPAFLEHWLKEETMQRKPVWFLLWKLTRGVWGPDIRQSLWEYRLRPFQDIPETWKPGGEQLILYGQNCAGSSGLERWVAMLWPIQLWRRKRFKHSSLIRIHSSHQRLKTEQMKTRETCQ